MRTDVFRVCSSCVGGKSMSGATFASTPRDLVPVTANHHCLIPAKVVRTRNTAETAYFTNSVALFTLNGIIGQQSDTVNGGPVRGTGSPSGTGICFRVSTQCGDSFVIHRQILPMCQNNGPPSFDDSPSRPCFVIMHKWTLHAKP